MGKRIINARQVALLGILLALALALAWVERFIPIAPGLYGVKLGLANTVLLYALYWLDIPSTVGLMLARVTIAAVLFAGFTGFLYSLVGGIFSLIAMIILKRIPHFSVIGVSIVGAVFHNIGQITVACVLVQSRAVLAYLPILLISAIVTGILTGTLAKLVLHTLRHTHAG